MSDGKGSKPRPFSVSQDEYSERWNTIFRNENVSKSQAKQLATMREDNTGVTQNDYQDILNNEDCLDE
jgi:hypothetical protein